MKKIVILVMMLLFLGVVACKEPTSSKEEMEQERTVQKIDSLERELEKINTRMDSISREAKETVEQLN
ncbi:hypothetical protein LB456_13245 [Psychroflexus sp. CAK57W]|uniref:hypothetical protein n=1 Tax=Psychroflexus curvus TaxID=2873595 RepID=UPI001CC9836E|nr:hypothetical protein [Psychroflexus curvus]MBZ9628388.1 hypothetical protein [Psychroflexus curvus]MBZ9788426.1 hypothetical protein [Psychroflexus curvus]